MSARVTSLCLVLTAWVLLSTPALAQDQVTPQELDELKSRVADLEAGNDALKKTVDERFNELLDAIEKLNAPLGNQQTEMVDVEDVAPAYVTQEEFNKLQTWVYELSTVQGQIAKRVSRPDGEDAYVLSIMDNMQRSPEFRQEMDRAVHDSMRRQGTLAIENQMDTYQTVRVNNATYQVAPHGNLNLEVPVGTVTTELVGYEQEKHWTLGPPNYQIQIGIRPNYAQPVYVDAPVYSSFWLW
jgi:hypothetical protein